MGTFFASPPRRRSLAYAGLCLGLLAIRVPAGHGTWVGNAEIHTLLETIATLLAFVIGAMALVRYYTQKTGADLFLGSGFLGAGLLDGYHAIVTSAFCTDCTPSSLSALIPWSGAISPLFLSILMCASLFAWRGETRRPTEDQIRKRSVYLLVSGWTLASVAIVLWVPLLPAYQSEWLIHRPGELVAGLFFAIATVGYLRKANWSTAGFTHSLLLFLIVETLSQIVYMPFSTRLFDALHLVSHGLKILAYAAVLSGLFQSMYSVFHHESEAAYSLTRAHESLGLEVAERQRAEASLQQSRNELEARVTARTGDLAEQGELAALVSDIAILLSEGGAFQRTLQRSAKLINHFLDAAFVRIWTLNKDENVLELQASAGVYTHLNGGQARVPVGQFKIGRIAQQGQPHLTNNVPEDSWVDDPEWARREGMIAFAGYPLMVGDEVVGVVAAFARHPFSKAANQTFDSLAGSISQFIGRKRMEAALQDSEERVRLLLDSTAEAIYGIDLKGNCTFANRASQRMLGYEKAEQLLGQNMHDLLHHTRVDGSPYPVAECHIFQAFRKGEGTHVDDEVLWRADGTSFPAEYWSYPVRRKGEVVGAVVTFLDISERKHAEDVLRTSEERFRIAAENAGDMTIEWDLRSGHVDVFGVLSARLGDRPVPRTFEAWKSMLHPDDLEAVLAGFGRHIETGERYVTQYRVLGERGSIYHYSLRGQAIRNAGGEPYKWIGLVSDITESKQAEEAISQLAAIAQCSEDAIIGTSLSGTNSHLE